ncbi:MAG: methyl-accepting chemotaxis protein, partial [Leptothrix sp. (in: b-proteobacteria)]
MRLSDLKIRSRLALAFGAVLFLTTMSGGVAVSNLASIQANLDDMVLDNNVKVQLNTQLSDSNQIIARVMRSIILLNEQDEKDVEMVKIVKARDAYEAAWKQLQSMPASDKGLELRKAIAAALEVSRRVNNRVLEADKARNTVEATALLMTQAVPAMQKLEDAITANVNLQTENTRLQYEQSKSDYETARNLLIGASALSAVLALVLGTLVTRSITTQLGGEPGDAVDVAQAVAAGDLSSRIHLQPGDTGSLMAQLKAMRDSLVQVVGSVRHNADSVATASAEIAQGNNDLSQRTEEQASALEETAASMEQLGSTVRQNADNAKQANQLATGASDVAVKGGEVVGQVVETMRGITVSSKKIADIIGVIDGIAFQTNILALNAAVEAARAGEQGRGFAVVATEVRNLAQRSANAAKEIKSLINASVEQVERGSSLVDNAGATMQEIVRAISRVSDIMGEINSASAEQTSGVLQIGEAVSQMDQATQQNAALVEESAAAAESLRSQAAQLVQVVSVFKLDGSEPASSARDTSPAPHKAASHKAPAHPAPVFKATAAAPAKSHPPAHGAAPAAAPARPV